MLGLIVVTLLTVAFATGTALRASPSVVQVRLEAYQLSGGLLSDLCDDHAQGHAQMANCWLCHLIAGCDLPANRLTRIDIERQLIATVVLPQLLRVRHLPHDPAAPTRGPPLT